MISQEFRDGVKQMGDKDGKRYAHAVYRALSKGKSIPNPSFYGIGGGYSLSILLWTTDYLRKLDEKRVFFPVASQLWRR